MENECQRSKKKKTDNFDIIFVNRHGEQQMNTRWKKTKTFFLLDFFSDWYLEEKKIPKQMSVTI